MLDTTPGSLPPDAPLADLGPLAWVFEELRKSLDAANKAIKRFVRETELSRHDDLEAVDPASLRLARQQLHQAVGALEMVGLGAPAQVLRAMEAAVQRFVQKPQVCTEDAAGKVERASFALIEYLESVLNNKPVQPVALFAQYRDVQELAAAERVHPADLWPFETRGLDVDAPEGVTPLKPDATLRSLFDRLVLLVVKTESPAAALQLARLCGGLSAGASAVPRVRTFWRVAGAYFEAVAQHLLSGDVYAKRAASRILLQFAGLAQGNNQVSETLLHDLLFFCAQAQPADPDKSPHLLAVRQAFGLASARPVNYTLATLGRYDPALLAQARKRINAAKESWSLFAGGDVSRSRQVVDQFGLIGDSLLKLHPDSGHLAQALSKAVDHAVRDARGVRPELAMEVATTTLFLEAAFEDFDPGDASLAQRTRSLAERLESVLAGAPAQPLDGWIEQLYRRVSDRQTLGSVVGELKVALGEAEKSLDQFFRAPQEKAGLHVAVTQLAQMRGVLSVLGLDQAVQAVVRMRTTVEQILDTEVDEHLAREAGTFQLLGNNLSALSFLVDMLNYQPALAKKLFVFDEDKGELLPLMGRAEPVETARQAASQDAVAISEGVQRVVDDVQGGATLADLSQQLDSLADQASLAEQPAVARAAREAAQAVVSQDAASGAQALVGLSQAAPVVPVAPEVPPSTFDVEDDSELLDIFLEEAREVVDNGREAIRGLREQPSDLEQLTTLRRAFHTLKGSSRMVGLNEFGEAAWGLEQVLNTTLAEQRPAASGLLDLGENALDAFARWVQDIADQCAQDWRAQPFLDSAAAWSTRSEHQHIALPGEISAPVPDLTADPVADVPRFELPPVDGQPFDARSFDAQPVEVPEVQAEQPAVEAPAEVPLAVEGEVGGFAETAPFQIDELLPDVASVPQRSADAPPAMLADIDFDSLAQHSDRARSEAPDSPAEDKGAAEPLAEFPVLSDEVPPADTPREAPPADTEVVLSEPAPLIEEPAFHASEPAVGDPGLSDEPSIDDQTKVIGPLRIGIKLYNVYLNEADEWSRRLCNGLAEWALERHEPVHDHAEALAHSLAGSSATVGFQPLSGIARALEHAIGTVTLHQQAGHQATAEQAQLFVDASEEIRRLLHQFAAGFYKEPSQALLEALDRVVHEPLPADEPLPDAATDGLDIELHSQWAAEPLPDADALVPPLAAETVPELVPAIPAPDFEVSTLDATVFAPLAEPAGTEGTVQDIDDDIDALDTIDADLFPIFADEAQELLPQLSGALRQWVARPENASARAEVLRNLHTLKGSARLAGALRLGEMAHRMETEAERLGSDVQHSADVEPLLTALDAITARFELLRRTDPSAHGVVQHAAELAPIDALPITEAASSPVDESLEPVPDALETPVQAMAGPAIEVAFPQSVATGQGLVGLSLPRAPALVQVRGGAAVRVRPELLDRLVNQTGEVMISRTRMETELVALRGSLKDLTGNLDRLRQQLRDIELQAETQMQSRLAQAKDANQTFDPLEFDRFTRVQELTRMMAESVNDVATVQRNLQRAVESTEDGLVAQARQTRELQRDLLRTRMVEFEGISERLYRVVRQASKETGKQVRLDIVGGAIEMDRGVLDRMTAAFEHLLRNSVVHGIESPEQRLAAGKPAEGRIQIRLQQELNDVSVTFEDDGIGLNLQRLREKALAQGLVPEGTELSDDDAAQLIYRPGLSTASEVSSLAGRGVGMDVVRNDVIALGGRIETHTQTGQGTRFKLVLPLTTAVTQVVMIRAGSLTLGVPSNLVEIVRRLSADELAQAYASDTLTVAGEAIPFYWAGALLQSSPHSQETRSKTLPVVIFRSAAQRVAMHVDEVLGNQEVVVKNLGPQLSRLPGLAGMSVLASGAVALIYNPVALATVYGAHVPAWVASQARRPERLPDEAALDTPVSSVPLVLVVDDSITVRRVTQRLLQREGYRVVLAADGLQALERLQGERPAVVLSDIEMPRMDGFDLVRNIRSDRRLSDLPVIMITSRIAEKHREHARELGVDHYLGKPYSEDELLALIGHYARAAAEA